MKWDSRERRKFVRVELPCEIMIRGKKEEIISTNVENISVKGVCVRLDTRLKPNTHVHLDIYGIKKKPLLCEGKIIWSKKTNKRHHYQTGIKFYKITDGNIKSIKSLLAAIAVK